MSLRRTLVALGAGITLGAVARELAAQLERAGWRSSLFSHDTASAPDPDATAVWGDSPASHRAMISFDELVEEVGPPPPGQGLRVALGRTKSGAPVVADLASLDNPHLLVCGTGGSGKTILLHSILRQLLTNNTPDALQLAVIDPKITYGGLYARAFIAHLWQPAAESDEAAAGLLDMVNSEVDRRYAQFAEAGLTNLRDWNATHPEERLPALVLLADKLTALTADARFKTAFGTNIGNIAMTGAGAGVYLILSVRRPTGGTLPETLRGLLNQRVVLQLATNDESELAIGLPGDWRAVGLRGRGDGFYLANGETTLFQGVGLEEGEIA